ncbi:MAG: hypothetical protein Q7U73_06495 [Rubrivivax sp.]|nr:hypothetical protein [Rubrivivax sp.]
MIELKTTLPGAATQRAQELRTQGGMVELSVDQLKHVAGGGFILAEDLVFEPPVSNGFILSE